MNQYDAKILIVEDDKQIRNFIGYALNIEGFQIIDVSTGQGALSILQSEHIDLILLDLGLPDMDGMEVIIKVRELLEIPIIVVSARDQDKDKVVAFDLGADDYLTKPFSTAELLARIRVSLRHHRRLIAENKSQEIYQVGGLKLDLDKRLFYVDGEETHMTPMEYNLLVLFFKNVGKVLTTKQIIKEIWGIGYGNDTQALRALMASLRRKIEMNPANPRYIVTEIGVGYRLLEE